MSEIHSHEIHSSVEGEIPETTPPLAGDPLFLLGQIVATPGALEALNFAGIAPEALLDRHSAGDWGDLCEHDRQMNVDALSAGERLLSAYALPGGSEEGTVRVWIVTEADRSATTLLLPGEY